MSDLYHRQKELREKKLFLKRFQEKYKTIEKFKIINDNRPQKIHY